MSTRLEEFRSFWFSPRPGGAFDFPAHFARQDEFWHWAERERAVRPLAERRGMDGPWRLAREVIEAQLRDHPETRFFNDLAQWLELAESGGCLDDELFGRTFSFIGGVWRETMMSRGERLNLERLRAAGVPGGVELDRLEVKEALDARLRRKVALALEVMDQPACEVFRWLPFEGVEWLLHACQLIETFGLQQPAAKGTLMESQRLTALRLAASVLDHEDMKALPATILEKFAPTTLLMVVDYSQQGRLVIRKHLETQLGFRELLALQDHVSQSLPSERRLDYIERPHDSAEFEVEPLRLAIDAVPAELLEWYCESLAGPEEAMVLQAVRGRNRAKLEASIKRHGQMALKSFSLLPLPADPAAREAEVKLRYVKIDEFLKGSKSFGAERQANNRVCAEVALQNLARHAGYSDADELFFEIESKAAAQAPPAVEADGCRASLVFDSAGPRIVFEKAGKPLKSMPAVLKKSPGLKELKAAQDFLKEQGRRFRRALELRMATGAPVERRHFDALWRAPLLRGLVATLLFTNADGESGLPDGDSGILITADGRRIPLGDEALTLAHPVHLERRGELAAWRSHCFETGLVQAIKQVFREFYVLTPAEEASSPASFRFAGHRVASVPLSGMFKNRGWTTRHGYDGSEPKKEFRALGIAARFRLDERGHFLTETESVVTGPLVFESLGGASIGLDQVPVTVFSEVMRDLDLFVSVAHTVGVALTPTAELMAQRFELLRGLVAKLKLKGVSLEGHFALIEGSLSTYRVHLASGAVFMGAGRHLCIVPANLWKKPPNLYLPFLEEDDRKVSEIFSKILLLSKDSAIKDYVILAQIAAAKGGLTE